MKTMVSVSKSLIAELRKLRVLILELGVNIEAKWILLAVNHFSPWNARGLSGPYDALHPFGGPCNELSMLCSFSVCFNFQVRAITTSHFAGGTLRSTTREYKRKSIGEMENLCVVVYFYVTTSSPFGQQKNTFPSFYDEVEVIPTKLPGLVWYHTENGTAKIFATYQSARTNWLLQIG